MLSKYKLQIIENHNICFSKNENLIPDKRKYILHYQNLKLYLDLELQLKKICIVLEFKLKAFLNS